MNSEQSQAIQSFAISNGRNWKSALRQCWMTGIYPADCNAPALQQIRNTFGPSWLVKFKLPPILDCTKMTFAQMAEVIESVWLEMKRRNPIGINFYEQPFRIASASCKEIGLAEIDNPSCEAGPGID